MKFHQRLRAHLPWLLAGAIFGELLYLQLSRYWGMVIPMHDLTSMAQAIWNAGQGKGLLYTTGQGLPGSRLIEHAEVIYFLLAPVLRLFPSAATLLVVEALVYALAAWPVYRLGQRYGLGLWLMLFYLCYPVAQTATLVEFHSDPLAMGFLMWALEALDRRAWRAFAFWSGLTLLSKVYMAIPVGLLGLLLWHQGERRVGRRTLIAAGLWFGVAFWGFKVWLAPAFHLTPDQAAAGYIGFRYGQLGQALRETWTLRLLNGLLVVAPALPWLAAAPSWALAALALILPALLTAVGTYTYYHHHYAVAVPFLVAAALWGSQRWQQQRPRWWRWGRAWTATTLALGHLVGVFWVWFVLALPSQPWRNPQPLRRGAALLAWAQPRVPASIPLATSPNLNPFFALRPWITETFGQWTPAKQATAQMALIDAFQEGNAGWAHYLGLERQVLQRLLLPPNAWGVRDAFDGTLLLQRAASEDLLPWSLQTLPSAALPPACANNLLAQPQNLSPGLWLECVAPVDPPRPGTVALAWVWRFAEGAPPADGFAVTRVGGWPPKGERWIHFPLWVAPPPPAGPRDQWVLETFSWPLHFAPGCYPVDVGWYRPQPGAYPATAEKALWGRRIPLGYLQVTAQGDALWRTSCAP